MSADRPPLPPVERWLVAAQMAGGIGVAIAWRLAGPTPGWVSPGFVLLAAGVGLAVAAGLTLGRSFRIAPSPRPHARLVRHGVYRWIRHPMYVSVVLCLAGVACLRPAGPVLVVTILNFVLYVAKARYEEGVLLRHYPAYAGYRRGTFGARARRSRRGSDGE